MDEPRAARPTINFIDEYCAHYRSLFSDVRSFEAFKHLHVGMLSSIKRKTLPAIAELMGLSNEQSLKLNFIVAIRSNHGVWLPKGQRVRQNRWRFL